MLLKKIEITICQACLDGVGSECHTPGCALWLHKVDLSIDPNLYRVIKVWVSEEICSRCGAEFREDEIPLRLWPQEDTNFMYSYCEKCTAEVLC
jgi:hypothetical protein